MLRGLAAHYRGAYSGIPRQVWLLCLALLVNRAGTMVLPFLALYLTRRLGLSLAAAGGIVSLYGFGALPAAFFSGWLSDRIGAVRVLVLSLAASGAGYLVLGQLRAPGHVALAVFLTSFCAESFRPAAYAAVAERAEPELRTRALALIRLANNLGLSIGPVVGGVLAVRHYELLFLVDALTSWLAALVCILTIRRVPHTAAASVGTDARGLPPWRDVPFLALLVAFSAICVVFCQYWSTLPLHWRTACGFREDTIGLLLAINTTCIALFEMALVAALEGRNRLRIAALGAALVCLGFGTLALGCGIAVAVIAMLVTVAGEMLCLPMLNSVVVGRAPSGRTGQYLGAYSFAFSLAFIAGPALGTAVLQRWGSTVLWLAIAVCAVPTAVALLALAARFEGRQSRACTDGR